MLEAVFDEVRKDVSVKFVVLAVMFVDEKRGDFPGDDDFNLTLQPDGE